MDADFSESLRQRVEQAAATRIPLAISGGNTKAFYGRPQSGTPLALRDHRGIVAYEPTELVISARAGTPLRDIEAQLARHGQMLSFEPPRFGDAATLGGTLACGLSGPRRPFGGAVRDAVLGVRCINGLGASLRFGGQVIKNVAGYDLSRLMVGALGTLGILLEASLKVVPRPEREITLAKAMRPADAITYMNEWAGRPVPLSAACYDGQAVYIRLSGTEQSVAAAQKTVGGDPVDNSEGFWEGVREHTHPFFADDTPLWRVAIAPNTPPLSLPGRSWIDWCGAQRWLKTDAVPAQIKEAVAGVGGHATHFRHGTGDAFASVPPALAKYHRRLKAALDPHGILNPHHCLPSP